MRITASTIFFNVDFKKGHRGLLSLLEKMDFSEREIILFVNKNHTGLKVMIGSQTMIYHKTEKLTLGQIRDLPTLLGGQKMSLSKNVLDEILNVFAEKLKVAN